MVGCRGPERGILGRCSVDADRLRPRRRTTTAHRTNALVTVGIYVARVAMLAVVPDLLVGESAGTAMLRALRVAAVAAGFAVLWLRLLPRGPLESVLHPPWRWSARPSSRSSSFP